MRPRLALILVACVLASVSVLGEAFADDASAYQQKGMTAYALGRYADAAENFEKAFELNADPAILYNAAQAHRLAGNKARALALYENYLRVFGKKEKRVEVETRIAELKSAIEYDKAVATKPPNETEPPATPVTPIPPPPPPTESTSRQLPAQDPGSASKPPESVLVAQPATSSERPLTKNPWFWTGVGAGVVVAALVVVLLVTGGSEDPSPSIGMVDAN